MYVLSISSLEFPAVYQAFIAVLNSTLFRPWFNKFLLEFCPSVFKTTKLFLFPHSLCGDIIYSRILILILRSGFDFSSNQHFSHFSRQNLIHPFFKNSFYIKVGKCRIISEKQDPYGR